MNIFIARISFELQKCDTSYNEWNSFSRSIEARLFRY